jgi:magnesium transporter
VYSTEKSLKEFGDKVSQAERADIEAKLNDLKAAIKDKNVTRIKSGMEDLTKASHKLAEEIYKQAAAKQKGFLWLDYYQPTKEELSTLIGAFGLHPLAIEDCTDINQVPKIEEFPGNTFIIFNALSYADKKLAVDEVDLFISEKYLITVSGGGDSETRRALGGIERIVEHEIESVRKGPAFLMHVILDYVVDQKFVAIEALEDQLDAAEEVIVASLSSFHPAELLRLRRDLLAIRKSLFHEREILVKICRKDCRFITAKAIYLYPLHRDFRRLLCHDPG